ncbi:hypothetical protein HF086_018034 [Spodoptera exigua]|uniref:glutamine synthetase n=1 Tax=Spodoptera exigua TaxID=7107 RepID=A0A922M166_SPOEX|nr:hypothetical protein HF086_018034 [Spodoptera exigua]
MIQFCVPVPSTEDLVKIANKQDLLISPMDKYSNLPISKDICLATEFHIFTDKFTYLMDKMEESIRKETYLSMTYSQQSKYMPPYYCPKNFENFYRVECRLRATTNKNTFDENFQGSNHRYKCAATYNKCKEQEPWFGMEQYFYLMNPTDLRPVGWPKGGYPQSSPLYYCGTGGDKIFGRELIDAHSRCCLYAGIPMWSTNPEVVPSQWQYRVGPSVGINAGDDAWMARFILKILAEQFGVSISFDPKPVAEWSTSAAGVNFSTLATRGENGISVIQKGIKKLAASHERHIKVYDAHGELDNKTPLSGETMTEKFSAGIADRSCSIRIPRIVAENKCGFLEDRRPASNSDPYQVIDALMRTVILNE